MTKKKERCPKFVHVFFVTGRIYAIFENIMLVFIPVDEAKWKRIANCRTNMPINRGKTNTFLEF